MEEYSTTCLLVVVAPDPRPRVSGTQSQIFYNLGSRSSADESPSAYSIFNKVDPRGMRRAWCDWPQRPGWTDECLSPSVSTAGQQGAARPVHSEPDRGLHSDEEPRERVVGAQAAMGSEQARSAAGLLLSAEGLGKACRLGESPVPQRLHACHACPRPPGYDCISRLCCGWARAVRQRQLRHQTGGSNEAEGEPARGTPIRYHAADSESEESGSDGDAAPQRRSGKPKKTHKPRCGRSPRSPWTALILDTARPS